MIFISNLLVDILKLALPLVGSYSARIDCDTCFFYRLQDLAGYGVAVATTREFCLSYPDRTFESPLVNLLIKNGRNGWNELHY